MLLEMMDSLPSHHLSGIALHSGASHWGQWTESHGNPPTWASQLSEKGMLPIVRAVLEVWSVQPKEFNECDAVIQDYPTHRCLDFGEHVHLSDEETIARKPLVVAIGLELKANPPARDVHAVKAEHH
jgi:hypothetical protein